MVDVANEYYSKGSLIYPMFLQIAIRFLKGYL